ncbi:hypothetical protein HBA12_03385 [Tenacibaculum mesophilum]|uniref:hypothetical protein n=1 Tax=Tenacibaculum mesophilum TaxID=104268 RepID=UPI00142FF926|nr:hypothetical protein [Tenacibaculum mesophilum]KAF9659303.1 hypothetical protein HBA12_03385 [Tenacibaculum mesophilum]
MRKESIENSVVSLLSMSAGAMLSRVTAKKLPMQNTKLKKGMLALAGVVGAAYLDRKTTGKSIAQDMAMGTAVTQTGELVKELLDEKLQKSPLLHSALGSPYDNWNEPFALDSTDFLSSYTSPNYDGISEDISYETVEDFNS